MRPILLFPLVLFFFLQANYSISQAGEIRDASNRAQAGERQALERLVELSGSKKKITYHFGNHEHESTEASLAQYHLWSLCSFDDSLANALIRGKEKDCHTYFVEKLDSLVYDENCQCWYITPFEKRDIAYRYKTLLDNEISSHQKQLQYLDLDTIFQSRVDSLIQSHDPKVFLELWQYGFSRRISFFSQDRIKSYICTLIGADIEVKDARNEYQNNFYYDFHNVALFNQYGFWVQHYDAFVWNDSTGYFEAPGLNKEAISELDILLNNMNDPLDIIAADAYRKLVTSNWEAEFNYLKGPRYNRNAIPIFWEKFLKEIRNINNYLVAENLEANLTSQQIKWTELLKHQMTLKQRRIIENQLIASFNPYAITAFEIEVLFGEPFENLQHSATRILDIYYSNNWPMISSDDQLLSLYLKKSACYDGLGIVGANNSYHNKFATISSSLEMRLNKIKSESQDRDIIDQINHILTHHTSFKLRDKKCDPQYPYWKNFKSKHEMDSTLNAYLNPKCFDDGLYKKDYEDLLELIPYELLPNFIIALPDQEFAANAEFWGKICNHYLALLVDCLDTRLCRDTLRTNLKELNELERIEYYLNKQGVEIRKASGALNFDVIYPILKHNVTRSFTGSSIVRHNEVYALIRILELELDETLGFHKLLITYEASNTANIIHRAARWRDYLIEKEMVKDNAPISYVQCREWKDWKN